MGTGDRAPRLRPALVMAGQSRKQSLGRRLLAWLEEALAADATPTAVARPHHKQSLGQRLLTLAKRAAPAGRPDRTILVLNRQERLARASPERLREMIRYEQVTVVFQPIVLLSQGVVVAYEALGRGRHPTLPEGPAELFLTAESIGAEAELSRLFRRKAVELCAPRAGLPMIFLNTHPIELARPGLLESLEELRDVAHHLDLALEIHERALAPVALMREVRALLLERNIALAYDGFGTGRARLLELADVPPHYLKFDRSWVHDLAQAPLAKRRLLHSLLALAGELNVQTVAVGIETTAEAEACLQIGFSHGQGSYFGEPRAVEEI